MDAFAQDRFDVAALHDTPAEPQPAADRPSLSDGRALRNVLGRFATGVTVVTCASAHGPVGMTVNSFTSLSLDPPLVMWAPAKSSRRYQSFAAAPRFAIHVLGAEQQQVADAFMRAADAFDGTDWFAAPDGLPLINGCLARLECETVAAHDAGDHVIEMGRVVAMSSREGAPLLYFRGSYAALG